MSGNKLQPPRAARRRHVRAARNFIKRLKRKVARQQKIAERDAELIGNLFGVPAVPMPVVDFTVPGEKPVPMPQTIRSVTIEKPVKMPEQMGPLGGDSHEYGGPVSLEGLDSYYEMPEHGERKAGDPT